MAHTLDIRIGTLVNGWIPDPAGCIRQILPYGFESFQITFWQSALNVDLPALAESLREALSGSGACISSIGVYGNPLENTPIDEDTRRSWELLIDHARYFGTDIVAGFTGRLRGRPIDESLPAFKLVFGQLSKRAADQGVRIAFENCTMDGTYQSGDWNIAHNPDAWERMFNELPAENLGLEWEPCHQMTQLIDPMPQLRTWAPKFFHIHGKDATIHWDVIRAHGIGGRVPFVFHRTPGFGDSNWTEIISELRRHGFTGSIDIEGWHDPVYRDNLEMTGQVHALNYLKSCRGGDFVPNPK